jgi:hypothetical protein
VPVDPNDGMDFVSSVNGSEYPPASHGVRFRPGDLDPLVLRGGGVRSGDGVGTAVEEAVVSPVADGVELSTESLLCNAAAAAAEDELRSEVTSMMRGDGDARHTVICQVQ